MPIQSNLSISPYFDDYAYGSDYYRVLFKPSTAVQVRELNQLQTILQRQVEEFGDVVLQRGTLLDGCQASFSPDIPFVKLLDVTVEGAAVDLGSYVGLFARGDNDNVVARIADAIDGFEAQDPNLKTLYLDYLNSGDSQDSSGFVEGETIEIYNNDYRLYDIEIENGSSNFANSDRIVILSAIEVQDSTASGPNFANSFVVGERLTGPNNQEVEIVEVNTTANTDAITLRIKPLASQLRLANTSSWLLANGDSVVSSNSNNDAFISRIIGSGARANFQTTRTGIIDSVTLEQSGAGYTILPFVTISTTENVSTSDLDTLDLEPYNYRARVQIATNGQRGIENPTTGFGYGMFVTEGKIYQNGHFLRVRGQNIIVSKYTSTTSNPPGPDNVAVGFTTQERIANSAVDPFLNDNAAGFLNENAPGADRLQLTPKLATKTLAESESDTAFFPIYKFSEGRPYSQRTDVQFNKVADEMARRTYEESGNYVLNPFEITTRSSLDIADSDTSFTYLIDPGLAYVNGKRIETVRNFAKGVNKATETETVSNTSIDLVYGNYVRCNEFAGLNSFNNGDLIELHGTAGDTISGFAGVVSDPNDQIGTARVRSIVHEVGIQGSSDAIYRVYLFNIRMNSGRNFKNVRSLYSTDGLGISDIVLETNSRGDQVAVLKETKQKSLLVNTRRPIKSLSNVTYRYRTSKEEINVTAAGSIQIARNNGANWPYTGELTFAEKNELIVLPEGDLVGANNLTGVVSGSGTDLTGNTSSFTSELQVGDFVVANGNIAQITGISDDTSATIAPNGALDSVTDDVFQRVYPKDVPIPLATRVGANAEVSGNNLLIDIGLELDAGNTATVIYNQQVSDATSVAKTTQRLSYVKIQANTHPETTTGPWCLGVPDVFRLRGVYAGSNTSSADITNEFYVEHNQTESYYGLAYLYQTPDSDYTIGADDELLVEFDCFERSSDGGLMSIESYVLDDTKALDEQTTAVNTLEIPELTTKDRYYDLRESFDFRPTVKPTATITNDPGSANTNPSESDFNDLFSVSNIKFPVPEGDITFDMEYYTPRTDTILLNSKADFDFMLGRTPSRINASQLPLYRVNVPAYPSLPRNLSTDIQELIDTRLSNSGSSGQRRERFTINSESIRKQVQGYTMEEIAQLERRISILEYYTNLSETENKVSELSLPSSIDSSIERFKFGFYVDNFSDYQFTNTDHPEFDATIFEYVLQPASSNYNIPLKVAQKTRDLLSGNKVIFPNNRKNLLSQSFATTGPPPTPFGAPRPRGPVFWSRACQSVINRTQEWTEINTPSEYAAAENGVWDGKVEENVFTLTSNTEAQGQEIELFFQLDYGTDRIIIEQSQSPSFSSSTIVFSTEDNQSQVEDLTNEDKRYLRNQQIESYYYPEPEDWDDLDWSDSDPDDGDLTAARNAGFLKWMGKFSFNYDIALGRYLKVTVQKGGPFFLYQICYPANAIEDPDYNTFGPADKFASDAPAPYNGETTESQPEMDTEPRLSPFGRFIQEQGGLGAFGSSNTNPDTSGDSSPNCRLSAYDQILIDRGARTEEELLIARGCKEPVKEPAPITVIEPPPDPDDEIDVEESIFSFDPGENRKEPEPVWSIVRPVEPSFPGLDPSIGRGDDSISTPTDPLETAIDQVDNEPPTFQPINGGGVSPITKIKLL
jgi:hypothetical protein